MNWLLTCFNKSSSYVNIVRRDQRAKLMFQQIWNEARWSTKFFARTYQKYQNRQSVPTPNANSYPKHINQKKNKTINTLQYTTSHSHIHIHREYVIPIGGMPYLLATLTGTIIEIYTNKKKGKNKFWKRRTHKPIPIGYTEHWIWIGVPILFIQK